jgi:hypothetical protein
MARPHPADDALLDLRKLLGDWLTNPICQVDTNLRECPGAHGACRSRSLAARLKREVETVA